MSQKEDVKGWLELLAGFTPQRLNSTARQIAFLSRAEIDDGSLSNSERYNILLLAGRLESAVDLMSEILTGEK